MDIHGALNAILKMRGYKICGGDPRGLLIDKVCIHIYSWSWHILGDMCMFSPLYFYFQ